MVPHELIERARQHGDWTWLKEYSGNIPEIASVMEGLQAEDDARVLAQVELGKRLVLVDVDIKRLDVRAKRLGFKKKIDRGLDKITNPVEYLMIDARHSVVVIHPSVWDNKWVWEKTRVLDPYSDDLLTVISFAERTRAYELVGAVVIKELYT